MKDFTISKRGRVAEIATKTLASWAKGNKLPKEEIIATDILSMGDRCGSVCAVR